MRELASTVFELSQTLQHRWLATDYATKRQCRRCHESLPAVDYTWVGEFFVFALVPSAAQASIIDCIGVDSVSFVCL